MLVSRSGALAPRDEPEVVVDRGRSDIADFERWVDLDLQYARTCSMWTDLRILLKTVVVVANVRGAH